MQKAFDLIVERLEEHIVYDTFDQYKEEALINMSFEQLEDIIYQVAEEYKRTAHYGCNDNGEHEKCDGCGIADRCPDYKKYLFENVSYRNSDLVIGASHSNEEVCEWKDSQMSKYYQVGCEVPKIILKLDTVRFKYCPYCGKKIKVIE